MLLQTNSYVVPREKRSEHARLLRRFRATLQRLGCEHFECYEQVGSNWTNGDSSGRFVQLMRFRDRKHQIAVQTAERDDPAAQKVIAEFCALVNLPYQQQQGLFAVGFYTGVLPQAAPGRAGAAAEAAGAEATESDSTGDADQPPSEETAVEEASGETTEAPEPSDGPVAADESTAAEASAKTQEYDSYAEEESSEANTEARHESEPFSR